MKLIFYTSGYTGSLGSRRMEDYVLKLLGTGAVVGTAAAYWMTRKPAKFNPECDYTTQSVEAQVGRYAEVLIDPFLFFLHEFEAMLLTKL